MRWWKQLLALWPYGGRSNSTHEAVAAQQAASLSQMRAQQARVRAAAQRAVAEELAASIRAHNTANHYDTFLQRVMQEGRE
jgi:hypothetical protein